LVSNGVFQTALPALTLGLPPGTLIRGRDYTELIPYFRPETRTALLIGLGGALHPHALAVYGIDVHAVEIEPQVVRLAAEYFGFGGDVTVMDGRAFLARTSERFDAVVIDTFLGGSIPEHLFTREAFVRSAEILNPGGIAALHLVGYPEHPAIRAVVRTLEEVFEHVRVVRSGTFDELQHFYLFASDEPLTLSGRLELAEYGFTGNEFYEVDTKDSPVLTDNRTNLALMCREAVAEFRLYSLAERRRGSWFDAPGL
jgi:hypothetical protein